MGLFATVATCCLLALQTLAAASPGVTSSDWWSLKPLNRPALPSPVSALKPVRNPVDRFIGSALATKGLTPSAEADRATLIRRLSYDLTGLPPTPEAIQAFTNDRDEHAYENLVERLLQSPAYGERWARHWLDVVHYGETHGYDKDKPRENAWPYRDYVIRSLNADKPYGRFVQEQVAGDVLFPDTQDGYEALGFIAAGPWDFIGHAEVPETKIDGQVARHLDRDDMVVNTLQTFNSLTVQCAQCHNHKFDPISQEDYYSLQAVFAAVDRSDQKYDIDPETARNRRSLTERKSALARERKSIDDAIHERAGQPFKDAEARIAERRKTAKRDEAHGYHSQIEARQDVLKWVQVDLGRAVPIQEVVLHPCLDNYNNIGEGFGFPVRYKVEASVNAAFDRDVMLLEDQTKADLENPKIRARKVAASGRTLRFIRVTATKLAPRQNDFIFALAELDALDASGKNLALGASVSALDSIEAPVTWQRSNLTDGAYPGMVVGDLAEIRELESERDRQLLRATTPEELERIGRIDGQAREVASQLSQLPPQRTAYVGAVHQGSGAFAGTGGRGGKPRSIFVLNRGNVQQPGKEVGPGTLHCIDGLPSRFELPEGHKEGERRAALAKWLTRRDNPLTWRSMANRVWQYHFGRGLVETPNDFGRMGGTPTHPELLDWLACELRDGGQSLKALHRVIVNSATYRQVSTASNSQAAQVDGDNRLLWRQNRRKLEAEAVRDAVLMVSGKLNPAMGGPSFKDFVIDKPEHSPHYEYDRHDPDDVLSHRRSIYRFIVRSQQQPFMTVLDCADPSMQTGKRNESLSPLQALALLNNNLMLAMSKHFAARLEAMEGSTASRIQRAHLQALGRPPTPSELERMIRYADAYGLANTCRLLFNLNEFSFVD